MIAMEEARSVPGASHMPPAAVTSTIMVMRGFVNATRSRRVSMTVAFRVATFMRLPAGLDSYAGPMTAARGVEPCVDGKA